MPVYYTVGMPFNNVQVLDRLHNISDMQDIIEQL